MKMNSLAKLFGRVAKLFGRVAPSSESYVSSQPEFHSICKESVPSREKPARRERIPDTFDGSEDELKDYLLYFEICANWNGWDYHDMGLNLAMSLRGPALQVLSLLKHEDGNDFDAIVNVLRCRFDPGGREWFWKARFRDCKKLPGETTEEYMFALQKLASLAYPQFSPEVRETLVVDRFVAGLPSMDIQRHVYFSHPATIADALASAVEFEGVEIYFGVGESDDFEDGGIGAVASVADIDIVSSAGFLDIEHELDMAEAPPFSAVTRPVSLTPPSYPPPPYPGLRSPSLAGGLQSSSSDRGTQLHETPFPPTHEEYEIPSPVPVDLPLPQPGVSFVQPTLTPVGYERPTPSLPPVPRVSGLQSSTIPSCYKNGTLTSFKSAQQPLLSHNYDNAKRHFYNYIPLLDMNVPTVSPQVNRAWQQSLWGTQAPSSRAGIG